MDDRKNVDLVVRMRQEGRKNLTGVTKDIKEMSEGLEKQRAAALKGEAGVAELEAGYKRLEGTLRGVAAAFDLSRRWEAQNAALAKVAARLDLARQKQEAFDASLTKGSALTDRQVREQERLAKAVDRAAAALANTQGRVDATAARLRAYGIDTAKIGDAQTRMASLILNGNVALKQQEDAIDRANAAQRRMAGNDVTAALDRIRSTVLGLAAAWMGVHRAVGLAGDSVDAFTSREGVKNQLAISVGNDRAAIDAEYQYVKAQADRIGIEFDRAARGYAKFSAAATLAGRSRQEIRFIWEAFAEVGRVANLSADDLDGVFKALEQITSKGKIQAEELRGQLGDRLFGAFQVAAKALKDQFPDLDKAMQNGMVTSEQLVAIAEQYRKTVADQLPAATAGLAAQQARYTNSVLDFKLAVADAGWADAFANALREITAALKSEDGKRLAESLAAGFSAAADAVVWLLQNLDQVLAVAQALASLWALNQAGKAAAGIVEYGKNLRQLSADIKTTVKGLGVLRGAFAVLQAAVAGWAIGAYLQEEFATVRKAGVWMVTGLDEVWTRIKAGGELAFVELPRAAQNAFADVVNAATFGMRKVLEAMQRGFRAIGREDLAANIGQALEGLAIGYAKESRRAAEIRARLERELAQIRSIRAEMLADADRVSTPGVAPTATPTTRPTGGKPGTTTAGTSEKDIAKRQRLVDEITRALESLDAKVDRSQTDSLQAQLAAIDAQYAALSRKIAAVGGEAGEEFSRRLQATLEQLRAQTIAKFNDGLAREHEGLLSKLDALDAAAGRKSKTDLQARLDGIRSQYETVYREIADFRAKLEANQRDTAPADTARARLDAGITELRQLETQRFYKEELRRLEGQINDALSARADRLKTIADQEAASLITSGEARQQTADTIATMQPKIEGLVDLARAFAESLRGAFDPVALDAFLAKLDLAKASGAGLSRTFEVTGRQIEDMIAGRSLQAFDSMVDALGSAAAGTISWKEAIGETGRAFAQFAAQFLREVAIMILRAQILKMLQSTGWGGAVAGAVNAAVQHDGGVVGTVSNRSRAVSPFVFKRAPRYHSGGVVGLAPDEYPAILQKNEEVLSADSPRNILNGGGKAGGAAEAPRNIRMVLVDDARDVANWVRSADGEQVLVEFLQRNASVLRSLGGA